MVAVKKCECVKFFVNVCVHGKFVQHMLSSYKCHLKIIYIKKSEQLSVHIKHTIDDNILCL